MRLIPLLGLSSILAATPLFAGVAQDAGAQVFDPATEAAIAERSHQSLEWEASAAFNAGFKYGAYDILAETWRDGCGPAARTGYIAHLGDMGLTDTSKPFIFEMFALPPLVRYLYTYGNCMSAAQKAYLARGLSQTRRRLFAHGTMNHMVSQETSWYLLAQYFPDVVWTGWNGQPVSSAEAMAHIKNLLQRRHWRSFQSGMNEMLSPTYALTNLYPLLNLVDFAKDPEVAKEAADEAALEVIVLKAHSFHGVIMPPVTRHNYDQLNGPMPKDWPSFESIAQQILWLYFGEPQLGENDFTNKVRECSFLTMLALSKWRPPAAAWHMPAGGYAIAMRTPEFARWDDATFPTIYGDTYIGKEYAIAAGNMVFDPRHYNDHNQTFAVAWQSSHLRNMLECKQPYWRSNHGEDFWETEFWSPFLESWRLDDHSAVLVADIPARDPWTKDWSNEIEDRFWTERDQHKDALLQVVECRIPKSVDELSMEGDWAFFREGQVKVALESLNGSFERASHLPKALEHEFSVIKVREAQAAVYVTVDASGESFRSFKRKAKAGAPKYLQDGPGVAAGRTIVRYVTPMQDAAHPGYWDALPAVTVDGKPVSWPEQPVVEAPFLTLGGGALDLKTDPPLHIKGPDQPMGPRGQTN